MPVNETGLSTPPAASPKQVNGPEHVQDLTEGPQNRKSDHQEGTPIQTAQKPTPMNDPDERSGGDQSVGLKWNVGVSTEQGQAQARLYVMYIKDAGGYVSVLDIVYSGNTYERSYPFGPKEKILTEPASRFARAAFEHAIDRALVQLRYQFACGDPVVLAFFDPAVVANFDGTAQSIRV